MGTKMQDGQFLEQDVHLAALKQLPYVYHSPLLASLPFNDPGIYVLTGGNLVGKTTLLKQWVVELLKKNIAADSICYLSGNEIKEAQVLIDAIQAQLKKETPIQYLILDDVSHVSHWESLIQFLHEQAHCICMLSMADKKLLEKIQKKTGVKKSFHLSPLSFHEFILLKYPHSNIEDIDLINEFSHFYLLHGGYLIAINDFYQNHEISDQVLKNFSTRLIGEIILHNKQEIFLREIAEAILQHYNKPITWNLLSNELSIQHPKTIGDYIGLLESLDILYVQTALIEEKLSAGPKMARKLVFLDPFIYFAIKAWLGPERKFFQTQVKLISKDMAFSSVMAKVCAITHFQRKYPTYYIKSAGSIDLAYVADGRFWPILINWANQLRPQDLKQILKYPNGKILTDVSRSGIIEHIRTEPLVNLLWKL